MTRLCLCGHAHEHPALAPFPRACARCGNHLCTCPAAVLPWTIYEALRALDKGERIRDATPQDR